MVVVNKKLGNGFVINDTKSVQDQEHYFGGYKKHITLIVSGTQMTASRAADSPNVHQEGPLLFISSSAGGVAASVSGVLWDDNNTYLNGNSTLALTVPGGITTLRDRNVVLLSVELSESKAPDSLPSVRFLDGESDVWGTTVTSPFLAGALTNRAVDKVTNLDDGWVRYEVASRPKRDKPAFRLNLLGDGGAPGTARVHWYMFFRVAVGTQGIYAFRNFRAKFLQELSDGGVEKFQEIDNQNTEKIMTYLSRNTMPKVE
jgi:hypothetical protein